MLAREKPQEEGLWSPNGWLKGEAGKSASMAETPGTGMREAGRLRSQGMYPCSCAGECWLQGGLVHGGEVGTWKGMKGEGCMRAVMQEGAGERRWDKPWPSQRGKVRRGSSQQALHPCLGTRVSLHNETLLLSLLIKCIALSGAAAALGLSW